MFAFFHDKCVFLKAKGEKKYAGIQSILNPEIDLVSCREGAEKLNQNKISLYEIGNEMDVGFSWNKLRKNNKEKCSEMIIISKSFFFLYF